MDLLLTFYMDSTSKGVWNNAIFRRIFHRQSVRELDGGDDYEIYFCLNQCVTSTISSALCLWYLLLDLEEMNESIVSDTHRDGLICEVLSENPHLNPEILGICTEEL